MVAAIRQLVTVKSGGVIEIRSPELEPGSRAEVIVLVDSARAPAAVDQGRPLAAFIGAAAASFTSVEQVDAFIRDERDAWGR